MSRFPPWPPLSSPTSGRDPGLKLALLPLALIVIGALLFLAANQGTGAAVEGLGQVAAGATEPTETTVGRGSLLSDALSNLIALPWLWTGGTGTWGLGWIDTLVPGSVWVGMIGVLVAVLLWGLRIMTPRKGIVMGLALLALTVIPLYVLYSKALRVGDWVQPRYLLPLLVIFVGLAVFGFAKDHLGFSRLQAGVLLAIVGVANSLSMHANMRRYITGVDESGFNLNANIEWWWSMPLSPMVVWFVGSAAFALTLAGLFLILYPKGERPSAPLEERAAVIRGM